MVNLISWWNSSWVRWLMSLTNIKTRLLSYSKMLVISRRWLSSRGSSWIVL